MNIDLQNFNPSYIGLRNDILELVPENISRVLEIGCSIGITGKELKKRSKNIEVIGIEIDKQMAKVAKSNIDRVIVGDIEQINITDYFPLKYFDCIIFADVLEHLKDPWTVLKNTTKHLDENGVVIISIPNIRHYTTILNLIFRGYWPYRERGLHDKTHLRFFTLKNIKELLNYSGLKIDLLKRKYRILEKPHKINRFAKFFAFPILREFLVFQYLIVAKKS